MMTAAQFNVFFTCKGGRYRNVHELILLSLLNPTLGPQPERHNKGKRRIKGISYHSNPDQLPVFYPPRRGYLPPLAYYPAVYPPAYAVYPLPYAFYPTAYPYAAYPPPLGMGWFPMAPSGPSPTPPQQNGSSLLIQPENTYSICSVSYE
ncbi:hypothetical protein SAY87_023959 [Trapa incisa]|uniref:Uncharacterized protein n=1 Tax=Trapa incisa TaxID=236973 RepID=A0AAN7QUR8_9MYRT|nr:hypothetical protein SAY87_023959 [Trapa incisa]